MSTIHATGALMRSAKRALVSLGLRRPSRAVSAPMIVAAGTALVGLVATLTFTPRPRRALARLFQCRALDRDTTASSSDLDG